MKSSEGYKLSKLIDERVMHLLYTDDQKMFASTGSKMNTVLRSAVGAMKDMGLHVNPMKCSMVSVKRESQVYDADDVKIDESTVLKNLKEDEQYKFLGILETVKQEQNLVLNNEGNTFLQQMSVIWSSSLSDYHRVIASNQFALSALTYLRDIDREARKIIVNNRGKHPGSMGEQDSDQWSQYTRI